MEAGPEDVGIESDITAILPDPPLARARLRVDNEGAATPFPAGDWLAVTVSARLYRPEVASRGQFDDPLAAGPEVASVARAGSWSVVDLPLPSIVRGEYAIVAKVFSADPRHRRLFRPSNCRVSRVTLGSLVRVERQALLDIYERGGYGNPAAEEELRHWVRQGIVVVEEAGRLFRAEEVAGALRLVSIGGG